MHACVVTSSSQVNNEQSLEKGDAEYLREETGDDDRVDQWTGRSPFDQHRPGTIARHEHRHRRRDRQVDPEKLNVAQVRVKSIENKDRDELDQTVQRHVLENAEWGHKCSSPFSNQRRNAAKMSQ